MMKNYCIVLRNRKNGVLTPNFAPVVDAFLSGGYFFDEVVLLPYEQVGMMHAKITDCLQTPSFVCVVVDNVLLSGVKNNLTQTFSALFEQDFASIDQSFLCVLPSGIEGSKVVQTQIVPLLNERLNIRYDRMIFRTVGATEERVQRAIDAAYAVSGDALSYHYTDDFADGRLEVLYSSLTPKMFADQVIRIILSELDEYIYALDDTPLPQRIYEALKLRKAKLSVAESFTGGGICSKMVQIPGVSEVFIEGVTAYANQAKMLRLGVKEDTLKHYGAVSKQTAHEMAEGLFSTGNCNVCVATTGIAGPKSDDTKKPVGLCYIAAGINGQIFVNEYVFEGDRERITKTAVNYALFSLFKLLKE
ncbi:MAG: CinA family protein [Clostridia bacterium]|nr:CinA family protein [Clostridia bacterium]